MIPLRGLPLANVSPYAVCSKSPLLAPMTFPMHSSATEVRSMRILLIEDNAADARLIKETLAEQRPTDIDLDWKDRLSTGLSRLCEGNIDGVLLDLSLPDGQGTEGLERIQAQAPDLAVLVLTHLDDEATAIHAVRKGAQDYLIKGGQIREP